MDEALWSAAAAAGFEITDLDPKAFLPQRHGPAAGVAPAAACRPRRRPGKGGPRSETNHHSGPSDESGPSPPPPWGRADECDASGSDSERSDTSFDSDDDSDGDLRPDPGLPPAPALLLLTRRLTTDQASGQTSGLKTRDPAAAAAAAAAVVAAADGDARARARTCIHTLLGCSVCSALLSTFDLHV